MSDPPRVSGDIASPIRVLIVGGGAEEVERLRSLLAQSTSTSFETVHVPQLSRVPELLDAKEADAMLLDLPPDRAGSLSTLIEAEPYASRIPVVAMGSIDDETLTLRALKAGCRGYLLRSEISTRLLVTAVRTALDGHRTQIQLQLAQEDAKRLTKRDHLTGLANRALFTERLYTAVAKARQSQGKLAVLHVDLDRFKATNGVLGHVAADALLRRVGRILDDLTGSEDTAARLRGDEFAVLVPEVADRSEAKSVAGKILKALKEPFVVGSRSCVTTACVGIAMFPDDGTEPQELITRADTAVHYAKERGRDRHEFFNERVHARAQRRAELETRLRSALEGEELFLYYQPQYDLRRGKITSAESLIRWRHPELGVLSPDEFLPLAEKSGLIAPMGEWILHRACEQNATWQGMGHVGFRIAVNVSPQQFQDPGLTSVVRKALGSSGLRPESLELEITESTLMQDIERTVNTMRELKQLGVRLSLDDFGTGYSSLAYLKRLPIDVLKIDQSFVRTLTTSPADATITETVIRMAHGLELTTVGEGVESLEQLLLLGSFGCSRMQGHLFGAAVPPETFTAWLQDPPFRWIQASPGEAGNASEKRPRPRRRAERA